MKETIIKLEKISKSYADKNVLKDISMEAAASEIVLIKGRSGAGKTTLLNICAFLENPDGGTYYWRGKNALELSAKEKRETRKNQMGFIFQDYNLFEDLTVQENLEIFLRYTLAPDREKAKEMITKNLERFNMSDRLKTKAKFLSGGERQRIAIIRAIMKNDAVIFADEPSANIDDFNREKIITWFTELKNNGHAVVLVSHDNDFDKIADRIYTLENGELSIS
ncbi:hypothetical protein CCDG5_0017 [[Clostridium] cellulosi]|uniref:ABC transporter domain-containing protein n=1 Tax=[Clostridium] cellulosi TaxID=29343 RepID=A0A078KL11_9FIRM|nr:hypothetical protein CCDG5_0017 [[Clostridium] cellulosi]